MERCPLCRARLRGQTLCPRCGADLHLAQCAATAAQTLTLQAMHAMTRDDWKGAAQALEQALALEHSKLRRHLRNLAEQMQAAAPKPAPEAHSSSATGTHPDLPAILPRRWWV